MKLVVLPLWTVIAIALVRPAPAGAMPSSRRSHRSRAEAGTPVPNVQVLVGGGADTPCKLSIFNHAGIVGLRLNYPWIPHSFGMGDANTPLDHHRAISWGGRVEVLAGSTHTVVLVRSEAPSVCDASLSNAGALSGLIATFNGVETAAPFNRQLGEAFGQGIRGDQVHLPLSPGASARVLSAVEAKTLKPRGLVPGDLLRRGGGSASSPLSVLLSFFWPGKDVEAHQTVVAANLEQPDNPLYWATVTHRLRSQGPPEVELSSHGQVEAIDDLLKAHPEQLIQQLHMIARVMIGSVLESKADNLISLEQFGPHASRN